MLGAEEATYVGATSLAVGGMAEVSLAAQRVPGGIERLVALKRLLPHLATEGARVERFFEEARTMATLHHPNVVQVLDLVRERDDFVIVLEYLSGETLRTILERMIDVGMTVPVPIACRLVAETAHGLSYLHEHRGQNGEPLGVIHGDVNPANVMACYDGQVKLIDFGVAEHPDLKHTDRSFEAADAYLAPERFEAKPASERADVYALGVVLFELLANRRPFEASNSAALIHATLHAPLPELVPLNPQVPPTLDAVVRQALARDPSERTPSARTLHAALDQELAQMGVSVGAPQLAVWLRTTMPAQFMARRAIERHVVEVGRAAARSVRSARPQQSRRSQPSRRPALPPRPPVQRSRVGWAMGALIILAVLVTAFWLGWRSQTGIRG